MEYCIVPKENKEPWCGLQKLCGETENCVWVNTTRFVDFQDVVSTPSKQMVKVKGLVINIDTSPYHQDHGYADSHSFMVF